MPNDLDALAALARAATPGPWCQDYKKFSHVYPTGQSSTLSKPIAVVNGGTHTGTMTNAAYIAAANPAAVLALIARVRELEGDAGRFKWILSRVRYAQVSEETWRADVHWHSTGGDLCDRDAIDAAMKEPKP